MFFHKPPFLLVSALALFANGAAYAQQSSTSPDQTGQGAVADAEVPVESEQVEESQARLGTVTVTAQRRESDLQDVPFSIMAFSGDQLQNEGIRDATELFAKIPSGYFMSSSSKTYAVVGMRGLTTLLSAPAADLPVAFFQDDIYYSSAGDMNLNMYDIEAVEVLRGPQGTLFGRNVTGGAIAVRSKKPEFEQSISGSVGVGNFGQVSTQGVLNGVLIEDRVAGRIAFNTSRNNGPIKNVARNSRLGTESLGSVRGSLRYEPTPDLRFDFVADYTNDEGEANAAKLEGYDGSLIPALSPDPFVSNQGSSTRYRRNLGGSLLNVSWATPIGDITSVTGYRRNTAAQDRDIDGTPLPIYGNTEVVDNRQFSQEIRLASPTDRWFSYVVGLYYLDAHNYRRMDYYTNPVAGSIAAGLLTPFGDSFENTRAQDAYITSRAVFGEFSFDLTDRLTLEIGGRYTVDEKHGTTSVTGTPSPFFFSPVGSGPYIVDFDGEWDAFTPKGTLKFAATDAMNFYLTVAEGFKGGGFTESLTTAAGLEAPFNPESTINYEAGMKSQWFDRRATLNVSVFRQETTDLQTQLFLNGINQFVNAGEIRQEGVELELTALLTESFRISLDYALLDAKFTDFGANTGNQLPFAPEHSLSLSPQYDLSLSSGATVTFAGNYRYSSEVPLSEANDVPDFFVNRSKVSQLDARIDYTSADGQWVFSLWGKNLTDDAVVSGAYDMSTFTLTPAERAAGNRAYWTLYNSPRTYGLNVRYNF